MKVHFTFTGLFSFCMSFLLSAWVTYVNLGFTVTFYHTWFNAFVNAWPIAFVVAFLVASPIRVLVVNFFKNRETL
ncbi:DUF2798 domain-containing protein [Pseudoalteromonas sp. Z9A5]|uniref:DUF2798 domain-containing protein n=1 Tax=Pseudoalteromonas sp. Z9A5 TaxID=2686355 RepID=UPI00140793A6|nr:DUF2798 domain-containing protein [Pseudoalteromonas sp. Z9A5]